MPRARRRLPTIKEFLAQLSRDCEYRAQGLLARRVATEAQIRAVWPGGAENADTSARGWVVCYGKLSILAGRHAERAETRVTQRVTERQALLDAMADVPELVQLTARDAEGNPRTVLVYPKGNVALLEVHQRNRVLARMIDDAAVLEQSQDAADLDVLFRAQDEIVYLQRLLCWIATTEGPRLPYPERTARPVIPEEFSDLSAFDYYAIADALMRVNVLRLSALHDAQRAERAPDWSVFFATLSAELGVPSATLMRDQSLASVIATAAERARGQDEATKRAEAERKGTLPSDAPPPMATRTMAGAA